MTMRSITFAVIATILAGPLAAEGVEFRHALTGKPLEFKYRQNQDLTEAVTSFYQTGDNPYAGDSAAIEAGTKTYKKFCQSCHLKDGTGRIGPNLTDETWQRERTNTEVGRFEIIYGGGAGAMQPFGRRMDQDDILKVMAFIDTFRGVETVAAPAETETVTEGWSGKKDEKGRSIPPVPFTEEFLTSADNISGGGEIWSSQCRHCHGAKAYPGKAPKLKPQKYKPGFVYRRVTDGFRKMPAWEEQYTDLERMQIVAYILSGSFSP